MKKKVLTIIGAPSSAGAYSPGQEKTPDAMRAAGFIELLRNHNVKVTDKGNVTGFRWKIGVIAILLPKYPVVKEWAYAGFFFAMSSAAFSHLAKNDGLAFLVPLIVSVLIFLSWYYRPTNKKILIKEKQ